MTIAATVESVRIDFNRFTEALLRYTLLRRWFRGKARDPRSAAIVDLVPLPGPTHQAFCFLEISYATGEPETYVLAVAHLPAGADVPAHAVISTIEGGGALVDGLASGHAAAPLLALLQAPRTLEGATGGEVRVEGHRSLGEILGGSTPEGRAPQLEQSNSTLIFGDKLLVKVYRLVTPGANPEVEIGAYLTDACARRCAPRVLGSFHHVPDGGEPAALGIAQEFVANQGDAWKRVLGLLGTYFDGALAGPPAALPPVRSLLEEARALARGTGAAGSDPAAGSTGGASAAPLLAPSLEMARILGQRTAEIHLALARGTGPAFAPEPFTAEARAAVRDGALDLAARNLDLLAERIGSLPEAARAEAERALARRAELTKRFEALGGEPFAPTALVRVHGDLHLGQVLWLGDDYLIIDFEGEPARPLAERRAKASPWKDVMGMVRSFDYGAESVARERRAAGADAARVAAAAEQWKRATKAAYLRAYLDAAASRGSDSATGRGSDGGAGAAPFLPADERTLALLLDVYQLDKVVYEIGYELNNRPDWIDIPLRGLNQILDSKP